MITFITICDADGVVDMTPPAIAGKTSIPLEIIQKGIDILSKPDPYTRTPGEDGVRIALIDSHRNWGWYLVNHEHYQKLQDSDMVRAQTKERVRKHRASKAGANSSKNVTVGNGSKRYTDTDTDTNTNNKLLGTKVPPTVGQVDCYLRGKGITTFTAQQFCDHYGANGWFRGKTKIKNWMICVSTWENKRAGDLVAQSAAAEANEFGKGLR